MSEQQASEVESPESQDAKADARAVIIVFCAAIVMAVHFVSGFTFDF